MGQLERGSKDENDCPVLGDWLCLGKTQGCPGSSAPRGGEAHSRHQRRRVGTSTRSPRSPGTARWSWPWLERWTPWEWDIRVGSATDSWDSQEGWGGRAGTPTLAIPQTTTDSGPSKRQALFSTLTSFKSESVETH